MPMRVAAVISNNGGYTGYRFWQEPHFTEVYKFNHSIFGQQLGKTPTETNLMLVRAYEDQALSRKCVFEGFIRFREGRGSVSDKRRNGKPAASVSDENIEKMSKLITKDRRLTVCIITGRLMLQDTLKF
ncbi:hypothetical protein TNCV_4866171 [Trichonephila clavipes]|nr:hypothetical protein TNCV_4866171 [Trichonephila clavipes]